MSAAAHPVKSSQSLMMDQFFYFFLRLRKTRVRKVVEALKSEFPDEGPVQLARRLVASQMQLSMVGGAIMHLPMLIPGVGQVLELIGLVGGASVLTRMHLYLILEIALLFGKDIDDEARVSEMMAVVAATGLAAVAPAAVSALDFNPLYAIPAAGMTASGVARLIGEGAIRFYGKPSMLPAADSISTRETAAQAL